MKINDIICCPVCQNKLDDIFFCENCKRQFKEQNGIFILITKELEDELRERKN